MVFDLLYRVYYGFLNPPTTKKKDDAIRFGLLGASNIAPVALIAPAISHPEVIVAAVAARDRTRAEKYAKKHNIPIVHATYEDLLQDPTIDAIYIALPDSAHYEWALRSLAAKKHVLLEKPCCSNATEARSLFTHPLVTSPGAPVLLEAFHYRFHPAWQTFLDIIHHAPQAGTIKSVSAEQYFPKYAFGATDIRWQYRLSGGCMMDFGTYPMNVLRQVLREEPREDALSAEARRVGFAGLPFREQVDEAMRASYVTTTGAVGSMVSDLRFAGGWWPFLPRAWTDGVLPGFAWPKCVVECGEKEIRSAVGFEAPGGERCFVSRKVVLWNHLMPSIYHRIDVEDVYSVRVGEEVVRTWKDARFVQAYTFPTGDRRVGTSGGGKEWWSSYFYQLEEFVNKVKGREGSGVWIDGEDSIKQMEAIDLVYKKAGMQTRPSSGFQL
ncbi:hypothetical protein N7466_010049 [Penicillium verhagenii]|uniref:uncharacterized protein n=1 Tax=Penicillium verhagenii TaxID=1562060 RepID=UPI002544E815|nr:uncharacterized protein N7466_010049 [Penicillium verhagenii]KAJ5919106.1 hypothetical protein N7466_010049 [Penicillium verhagenii]